MKHYYMYSFNLTKMMCPLALSIAKRCVWYGEFWTWKMKNRCWLSVLVIKCSFNASSPGRPPNKCYVFALMWTWWLIWNKVNVGEKRCHVNDTLYWIIRNVVDYEMLCLKKQTTTVTVAQRWKPPGADVLKVNIDGSFFSDSAEGGSGFIVRDNSCNAVALGAGKHRQLQDPMHAEAEACLHAFQEAQTCAMRRITRHTHRNWWKPPHQKIRTWHLTVFSSRRSKLT